MPLWLIGSGPMAAEYAKVLKFLKVPFKVVGRSTTSAIQFQIETGCEVETGGLDRALTKGQAPEIAIVAVGIEQLLVTTASLIQAGTKRILIEKPGGLNILEVERLSSLATSFKAQVFLGYNRRYYSSVRQARDHILEDGGILSIYFEFTEWSHQIEKLKKPLGVKEHWLLGNSSHVLDLAFHLAGRPRDWNCWHSGSGTILWHPASARFAGAGLTENGVLFSYMADWQAPGRWGVDLLTARRRLILRPMEHLQVMKIGSVDVESLPLCDTADEEFKPGLLLQTKSFILEDYALLPTLREQVENVRLYSKIAGY